MRILNGCAGSEAGLSSRTRPAKLSISPQEKTMKRTILWAPAVAAVVLCLMPQMASAQSNPQFIAFPGTTKGAIYRPDAGPAPHVGILVMHRTSNYLNHRACTELS